MCVCERETYINFCKNKKINLIKTKEITLQVKFNLYKIIITRYTYKIFSKLQLMAHFFFLAHIFFLIAYILTIIFCLIKFQVSEIGMCLRICCREI